MNIEINVIMPVSRHRLVSTRDAKAQHDQAVREILDLSGTISCLTGINPKTTAPIEIAVNSSTAEQLSSLWQPHPMRIFTLLEFKLNAEIDANNWESYIEQVNTNSTPSETLSGTEIIHYVIAEHLQQIAYDVAFAANIGLPGSVDVENSFTFADGRLISTSENALSDGIAFDAEDARERRWPPLSSIPVSQVWGWLQDIHGFDESLPQGPAGRAVSALSYLMSSRDGQNSVALMWALVGLEALYTTGSGGHGFQLFEKSQVVLGAWPTGKTLLREIYNVRSRYIHGDIDFALSYSRNDDWDVPGTFEERVLTAVPIAISMLLSSLQKLILINRQEFEFKYSLVDKNEGHG